MRTVGDQLCVNLGTRYVWISLIIHILPVDKRGRLEWGDHTKSGAVWYFPGDLPVIAGYGSAEGTNYASPRGGNSPYGESLS
jgi:hypothetical protein